MEMQSKTKVNLSQNEIDKIIQYHFNETPLLIEEIVSGFFARIYKILMKSAPVVIKVYPVDSSCLLTYEKELYKREVKVFALLSEHDVPVPKILFVNFEKNIIPYPYYISEYIEGETLFSLEQKGINIDDFQVIKMKYLARIHQIRMDHFGYDSYHPSLSTMSLTFSKMMSDCLIDGQNRSVNYPTYFSMFLNELPQYISYLDDCIQPVLLHFDLWNGNVFVSNHHISAILDTERSWNGDPIADFSVIGLQPLDPNNKSLIDTYNQYSKQPISKTYSTYIRYVLYRFYLFTIMYIETFYRDFEGSYENQKEWCIKEFECLYKMLKRSKKTIEKTL